MPPRLRLNRVISQIRTSPHHIQQQCFYASLANAITPSAPIDQAISSAPEIARFPSTQPPSHKPPELRKSQLHRQYQSLLHSSPILLIFQHNNLKAVEWASIRRELAHALRTVDAEQNATDPQQNYSSAIKLQIIQTGIFASALRVVEFYHPEKEGSGAPSSDLILSHGLSTAAHKVAANKKLRHGLEPLLSGPLAVVSFPTVSTDHLKAALSILAPNEAFPAPRRKARPSYHELAVHGGLQKLMLLGARVEGKAFDTDGTRWVGGIQGGMDGLRAQLVAMLQGIGAGITGTLEAAGRSVYFTLEGRKTMLEGEENKGEPEAEKSS